MKPINLGISLCFLLTVPDSLLANSNFSAPLPKHFSPTTASQNLAGLRFELAADNRQQRTLLFNRALEIASLIESPTDRRDTLLAIASKMTAAGEKERSLQALELAIKSNPEEEYEFLSRVGLQLAKLGESKRSQQIFNRALQLHRIAVKKGAAAEDTSYNNYEDGRLLEIIHRIAEAGQLKRAIELTPTIRSRISQAAALNYVATIAIAKGDLTLGKTALNRALRLANRIGDKTYDNLNFNDCSNQKYVLLSEIALNLMSLGEFERTLDIASRVYGCVSAGRTDNVSYKLDLYTELLDRFRRKEQVKKIWSVASRDNSDEDRLAIRRAIAIRLVEVGEIDLALQATQKVTADIDLSFYGYLPWASYGEKELTQIAFQLAEAGHSKLAAQIIQPIPKYLRREVRVLLAISEVKKLRRQGKYAEAKNLLARTLAIFDPSRATDIDSVFDESSEVFIDIRRRIALELATLGEVELGLQVKTSVLQGYWQSYIASDIAEILIEKGNFKAARKALQEVGENSHLSLLVERMAPQQDKQILESMLDTVQKRRSSRPADRSYFDGAIAAIASRLIALGEVDRGLALGKEMESAEEKQKYALEIAKLGKLDEARAILQSLPDNAPQKAEAIADLAARYP